MKSAYITKEAQEIKDYYEKNRKMPMTCNVDGTNYSIYTMAYMMGCLFEKNYVVKDYPVLHVVKYNTTQYKDTINHEEVLLLDYVAMIKKFLAYCRENKRVPSYITTVRSKTKVSFELFTYCLAKILVFYSKKKTNPNYCIMDKADLQKKTTTTSTVAVNKKINCENPYTSTPHLLTTAKGLGQKYPWSCSAHTVMQELYKLTGIKVDEDTLIKVGGVTTKGVGHDGINTMIAWFNKKYGFNLKVTWKNFSDLGETRDERFKAFAKLICKSNTAILTHIGYAHAGKSKIQKGDVVIGHYEGLDKVNIKTKYVRALNSLGSKINANAYAGHLQDRTYETQASFFANTPGGQKALCIITK